MYNKDLSELEVISKDVARLIAELSAAIVHDRGSSSKIRSHLLEYENKIKQLEESAMAMNNLEKAVTNEAVQVPNIPEGSQGQDAVLTQDPALANQPQTPADNQPQAPADNQPAHHPHREHAPKHAPQHEPKHEHKPKHKDGAALPANADEKDSTPVDKSLQQNVSVSGS